MSAHLNLLETLTVLDHLVFGLILGLTFAVVILGARIKDTQSVIQYMLMGRRLTLPFFVATLVATWYGGIFGVTQIAFESGLYNFLTQGMFWYLTYLIFAWFVVDRITDRPYKTLPEVIQKKIGPKSAFLASMFNIANVLPISYVISIGLLLNFLFGIPLVFGMILGTSFVVLYSFISGFRAIVLSDTVQFVIMVSSVITVLVVSVATFGGLSFLRQALPSEHLTLLGKESFSSALVWGFIALSTLVDPNFYQRCFAAKDKKIAKKGIYLCIVIWVVFDICTTFGGLYARALLPNAPANEAYLIYALQLLPDGLKGFFLAGIVATILSTIDSNLFIASNTIAYDLLPRSLKKPIFWHRFSMFWVAGVAIALGTAFEGNIKAVWKTFGSYSAACLLFPVVISYFFPKKISDGQFFVTVLVGTLVVTYHRLVSPIAPIDGFYVGMCATMGTLVISGIVSFDRQCWIHHRQKGVKKITSRN